MAQIVKGGFSCAIIEETQFLNKKTGAKVREERKRGVEFPVHRNVEAAIERHPAIVRGNQTDSHLPCQNGTAMNPQTCWRHIGTGAPPPDQCREPTAEPMPPPPGILPAPPSDYEGAEGSQTKGLPTAYVYIHTPLPNSQCFNLDAYAKDSKRNKDFIPDLLAEEGTSTG